MRIGKGEVLVFIAVFCLLPVCFVRLAPGAPAKPAAAFASAATPSVGDEYSYPFPGLSSRPSTTPEAAQQEIRRSRATAAAHKLQRQNSIAVRFLHKSDPDDLAFVRWLLPAARNGDPDAQDMLANVLESCDTWNMPQRDGKTWREKLKDPNWNAGKEVRFDVEQQQARCDSLAAAPVGEIGTASAWKAMAFASGNGEALIENAENTDNGMQAEERVSTFNRALTDADPAALNRIIVLTPDYQQAMQADSNDFDQQAAIRDLALCQLGDDCTSAGYTLQQYCSFDECRGIDSLQRYFEMRLSPEEFSAAQQRAQYFVDHFLDGGDNWPEAQAYEQHLRQLGAGG